MKPQYSDFEIVGENYILVAKDEHVETKKTYLEKLKNYHIYQLLFYQL